MRRRRPLAWIAAALAVILSMSGAKGCVNGGQAPAAHASTAAQADAQHPPQPGTQPAQPIPDPDPWLIDHAKDDPHYAVLMFSMQVPLAGHGVIRTMTIRWFGRRANDTTKVNFQGSDRWDNHWYKVLIVDPGQHVGFTAAPGNDKSVPGYALCAIYNGGLKALQDNSPGQQGGCGASWTIGT